MGQSQIFHNLSVSFADSIPTPFVPSGHFPLIGGISPWKGSLGGARLLISDLSLIISIDHRAVFGDDERVGVVFADDGA